MLIGDVQDAVTDIGRNEEHHTFMLDGEVPALRRIGETRLHIAPSPEHPDLCVRIVSGSGIIGFLQHFGCRFGDLKHRRSIAVSRAACLCVPLAVMKKVGITGPPGAGKTTLWRAISGAGTKGDIVAVAVPDERLHKLTELHSSRKTVPAQIEVVDVHSTARTAAATVARLRDFDALVAVLPAFGGQDAAGELQKLSDELLLADMVPVETRLGRARKDPAAKKEVPTLQAAMSHLEQGKFLSSETWETSDLTIFSPLALLTLKPLIVVFNVDEASLGGGEEQHADTGPLIAFSTSASLEAEVAGMGPQEAAELLNAYGIEKPVLGKVIQAVYRSLDLITFFTTGEDESRAWEVRKGAAAPEAAGAIHSDIQRGFIRAEVIGYPELVDAGSWDAAKAKGLLRVEGKEYVFQEGDVTHFRFAV